MSDTAAVDWRVEMSLDEDGPHFCLNGNDITPLVRGASMYWRVGQAPLINLDINGATKMMCYADVTEMRFHK